MEKGRVPPCDVDLEASVVSACVMQPEFVDKVIGILEPKHLYLGSNRLIYQAVLDRFAAGASTDGVLDIRNRLVEMGVLDKVGGAKRLAEIIGLAPALSNSRVYEYCTRLKKLWQVRQLISNCQLIAAKGYSVQASEDIDELLQFAEEGFASLTASSEQDESFCTIKEAVVSLLHKVQSEVLEKESGAVVRPKFGFSRLDKLIGGMDFGEFVVVAARPSIGKSSFLYCVLRNVLDQKMKPRLGAHIISAETVRVNIAASMVAQGAKVDISKFQTLEVSELDWKQMVKGMGDISSLPITIDDRSAPSVAHIRASVRKAAAKLLKKDENGEVVQRLGIIAVDFMQLCETEMKRGENREQAVARVARLLQSLAKDYNAVTIGLSQLNRGVEDRSDKRPQMSDIRNSGEIEQAASKIVAIYRDDYYKPETKDKGLAELIVLKSKMSGIGVVRVKFTGENVSFNDLEETEYED